MKKISPILHWFVLLSAILLPFLVIRFFPKLQHTYDLRIFREWSAPWQEDWHSIYMNCESCNYPFIGTLLSGGVMSTIDFENIARVNNRFRYYLAIMDGVNVLAIWLILTWLQVKHAPFWAGVIGLLPTSWIGSSTWGQIDGMGQFFILLFFITLILLNNNTTTLKRSLLLFVAGILLALMLLTKQLIYFSMGALGLILLVNLFWYSRKPKDVILSALAVFVAFAMPIFYVDSVLQLPDSYVSHIQYILATGSQHGDIISSLGFNIWVFFTDNLLGSSHFPLQIGSLTLLSPYSTGLILFFILNAGLFFLFLRNLRSQKIDNQVGFHRDQLISALFYFALVNLSFNLALTGTHERYLYHFYPFIIMACLACLSHVPKLNRILLAALLLGSLFYGAFLYGYLAIIIRPLNLVAIRSGAFIHLVLFIFILYTWMRNSNPQTIPSSQT